MRRPFNLGSAQFSPLSVSLLDAERVAANRRGDITLRQREEVLSYASMSRWFTRALWIGGALAGIGTVVLVVLAGMRDLGSILGVIVIAVLASLGMQVLLRVVYGSVLASMSRAAGELAAGRIETATGQVVWNGKTHVVKSPRPKPLHLPALFGVALPPGEYRFYVLPESGWILSAESPAAPAAEEPERSVPLASASPAAPVPAAVPAEALGMTAETLAANRDGRLTGGQRRRLLRAALGNLWLVALTAFIIWFVSAVGLLMAQKGTAAWSWSAWAFAAMFGCAFLLIPLYTGLRALVTALARLADVLGAQVLSVDGNVGRAMSFNKQDRYRYVVDGRWFSVTRAAFEALPAGQAFRVYYARFSKTLLGMEPLAAVPNTMRVLGER